MFFLGNFLDFLADDATDKPTAHAYSTVTDFAKFRG